MVFWIYKQSLISLLFAIIFIIVFYGILSSFFKTKTNQILNCFAFTIYVIFVLYLVVFSRVETVKEIQLKPFYSFVLAKLQPEIYRSVFMNVLFFTPFGMTMPYILSYQYKKKNILITVLSACVFSITIEFTQYYFSIGRCETDDVIFNTLGAFVGASGYWIYGYLIKESDKMENKLSKLQNTLCELCANALFGKEICLPENPDIDGILTEAKLQTVLPTVILALQNQSVSNEKLENAFLRSVGQNVRISCNHTQIAKILSEYGIGYLFIKGVASASYYSEPDIRMMGDVDILIKHSDIKTVNDLLCTLGYTTDEDIFKDSGHIVYKRKTDGAVSVCEVHFNINGIPHSLSDAFENYLSSIFENAKTIDVMNQKCLVPCDLHHGIILLLHTATHLTSEGVGLRHLCDWAVFVNSFSSDDFVQLFEKPLKELGLWRFARLLTLCCNKYLGCDSKVWAGTADISLLDYIIADIINGGNFGNKDADRYAQIKYIYDRENHSVVSKCVFSQALSNINAKAESNYGFVKKHKILLPVGWIAVIFDYLMLVLTRKRKLDNISTINSAKQRQSIYSEFKLFEKDD